VKILWAIAFGKHFDIQVSTDAVSWRTIKAVKANKNLFNDFTNLTGSARYVRIYGTKSGTDFGYAIAELEVYGRPVTAAHARLSASAPEEGPSSEVNFYPNPAKNILYVAGLKNGSEVQMIPANGTLVYKKTVINESVDISDIPPGLYIVDCHDGTNWLRKKVVKE
jgi:hypothetical protein